MKLFRLKEGNYTNQKSNGCALLLVALALACFALSPQTRAACDSPDPGCAGGNLAEGFLALGNLTNGIDNTAVGWFSLKSVTTGNFNTGLGAGTLVLNTGNDNTATGVAALLLNTTGTDNTANGTAALVHNATGNSNTAIGAFALNSNTTSDGNTANGASALFGNTTGGQNTAIGLNALYSNTTASANTAIGWQALFNNELGNSNTAIGSQALAGNMDGFQNSAIGDQALSGNSSGGQNTVIGYHAGSNITTGSRNVVMGGTSQIGSVAGEQIVTADDVICIGSGNPGANISHSCFISNILGVAVTGVPVVITQLGQLGTMTSSRRFKHDIKPMEKTSASILALKPVTFHYKSDKTSTPQFGLIAEEVAKVNPDLVVRDNNGDIYTVRYDAVNVMLLNEFQKEHRKVEQLEKQIEALTEGFQKVSAQLEASKPAPQVVNNP
jgi:hypothetical protein